MDGMNLLAGLVGGAIADVGTRLIRRGLAQSRSPDQSGFKAGEWVRFKYPIPVWHVPAGWFGMIIENDLTLEGSTLVRSCTAAHTSARAITTADRLERPHGLKFLTEVPRNVYGWAQVVSDKHFQAGTYKSQFDTTGSPVLRLGDFVYAEHPSWSDRIAWYWTYTAGAKNSSREWIPVENLRFIKQESTS